VFEELTLYLFLSFIYLFALERDGTCWAAVVRGPARAGHATTWREQDSLNGKEHDKTFVGSKEW